jgi:hypothetical protein
MAKQNFYIDIDGNQNEIQNWSLQKLATDPVAPFAGQFWQNTTDKKFKFYDGTSVITLADAADVAGLLDFKGGYDAATNTPDLDTAPVGVLKGDAYVVTAAGNFFTEAMEVGDMIFAKSDGASTLADWVTVQNNIDQATETVKGIAAIATQAETTTGVDDSKIITPLKLKTELDSRLAGAIDKFSVNLDDAELTVTRVFAGGATTYTITHGLGEIDTVIQVKEIASGENIGALIDTVDANTIEVKLNGSSVNNTLKVTVIG